MSLSFYIYTSIYLSIYLSVSVSQLCLEQGTRKPSPGLIPTCSIISGGPEQEREKKKKKKRTQRFTASPSDFSKKQFLSGTRTNPLGKASNPCLLKTVPPPTASGPQCAGHLRSQIAGGCWVTASSHTLQQANRTVSLLQVRNWAGTGPEQKPCPHGGAHGLCGRAHACKEFQGGAKSLPAEVCTKSCRTTIIMTDLLSSC